MAKDRSRDDRRSVGSHEKMMGALGRATGALPHTRELFGITFPNPKLKGNPAAPSRSIAAGKGHVVVGKSSIDYDTGKREVKDYSLGNGEYQGTAGVSGKHRGEHGAPSNIDLAAEDKEFERGR